MKSTLSIAAVVIAIAVFMFWATPAKADELITFKPSSVTELKDKNGNAYVRMLWTKDSELNGVKYQKTTSVNAYRDMVPAAKLIKPGQEVTLVASKSFYQGREYYTVMGIGTTAAKKQ